MSGSLIPLAPFYFLKIALAFRGLLCFHTNCEIFCSSSVKNASGSLIGIAFIENPKDATRKLPELINEFGKVAEQKSLAFLYTNGEKSESEIKETLLFTTATKRIKYLGINLPKETKDLHAENYKTMMKEIKDDTNRWRDIPCSWIG